MVKDACTPEQVQAQVDRLVDQAAAERAAKVARMSHKNTAQLVNNMLPKGEVFRDLLEFHPRAAQHGDLALQGSCS